MCARGQPLSAAGRPGDHLIYLRADGAAGYDRILDAADAARAAGVRRIGAITQPARLPPVVRHALGLDSP